MAPFPLTSFYAALSALVFVVLSVRVIGQRRASGITLGVGDNATLARLARVHANFAEYVPLALILLMLTESAGHSAWIIHAAGLALVAGRIVHAVGVSREPEDFRLRAAGVGATLGTVVTLSLVLLAGVLLTGR